MKRNKVAGLRLRDGEAVVATATAVLMESRVASTGYAGGSRGLSIRIMRGVSWRVGAHSGSITRARAWVSVAAGTLVITDSHLIFHSVEKSFVLAFADIEFSQFGRDHYIVGTSAKPKVLAIPRLNSKLRQTIASRLDFESVTSRERILPRRGLFARFLRLLLVAFILFVLGSMLRGCMSV